MARLIAAPVLGLAALFLLACGPLGMVRGSGHSGTREFDIAGFTGVDAGFGFDVTITQGEQYRVSVTADDNLLSRLEVELHGDTLGLGAELPLPLRWTRAPRAEIVMPSLEGLELSGGAKATVAGFSSDADLRLDFSGGSRADGDVSAGDVTAEMSGGSRATLRGQGLVLRAGLSGGSRIDFSDFPVQQASIDASGGSQANVNVIELLEYDLSGGSRVNYRGQPEIGRSETSGGSRAVAE